MGDPPHLTVAEAAERLEVSLPTIYHWLRRGDLVGGREEGGRRRKWISEASVNECQGLLGPVEDRKQTHKLRRDADAGIEPNVDIGDLQHLIGMLVGREPRIRSVTGAKESVSAKELSALTGELGGLLRRKSEATASVARQVVLALEAERDLRALQERISDVLNKIITMLNTELQ